MSRDFQNSALEELRSSLPVTQEDDDDILSEIDIAKLAVIAQKSLLWIILLFLLCFSGAFIYFRMPNNG